MTGQSIYMAAAALTVLCHRDVSKWEAFRPWTNANAPAEDFAGSRVEAGQKLYALPGNSGSIYVEYTDGFAEFVLEGASK